MRGTTAKRIRKLLAAETLSDHQDRIQRLKGPAKQEAFRKLYRWMKRQYKAIPGPASRRWKEFLRRFQTLETEVAA